MFIYTVLVKTYTNIHLFFAAVIILSLIDQVLKVGNLHKTSQSRKTNAEPGPTRQRRFRLTAESLEYFQQFSHVRVRQRFELPFVHTSCTCNCIIASVGV